MILSNLTNTLESQDKIRAAFDTPENKAFVASMNKAKRSALISASITGTIMFLIPLLLIGIGFGYWGWGALFGFVIGVIFFAIIEVASTSSINKKISDRASPILVKAVLGDNAVYDKESGFSRSFLSSLRAFPVNIIDQSERIHGSYSGVPFMCADVNSYHYETHSNGRTTTTTKVDDFNGTVFIFRFNKPSDAVIRIVQKGYMGFVNLTGKAEKMDTESIEYNNSFNTYVNDKQEALFVLTPQNILALLGCKDLVKGKALFIIDKENLVVIASGLTRPLAGNITGKFDYTDLMRMANQLVPIKGYIKTLDLENTYWRDIERLKNYNDDYLVKTYGGPSHSGSRNLFTVREGGRGFNNFFRG